MLSPDGTNRRGGVDILGVTPKKPFTFRRLAHAMWPSVFEEAPSTSPAVHIGGSPSPNRNHSNGVVVSSTPLPTGFGGGRASSSRRRNSSSRGAGGGASSHGGGPSHKRNVSDLPNDDDRYSLSPSAIEASRRGAKATGSDKEGCGAMVTARRVCSKYLKSLGRHAYRLWLLVWQWLCAMVVWAMRAVGMAAGGKRRRGHRHGLGDDDVRGGRVRQSSEVSLSDDSPGNTPTAHLRGLVVPMQGDRKAANKKRRNVYYDVEEASYRPMHRLLFMRERSINPVSQKKVEVVAAALRESVGGGGGGGISPSAGTADDSHRRQLSDSGLIGVATGTPLMPLNSPSPLASHRLGQEYAYALTMGGNGGDSAQVLLASPIAGLTGADGLADVGMQAGDGAGGANDGNAAADGGEEQQLSAAEGGYYQGKYGDKVCDGTFILVSQLGSGAFSTVWLAIDVKGATSAIGPALMFQNRMDDTSYNATAAVMKQRFAFVVLKISKSALPYRQACEKEFETHQQLYLRLQREGFDVSKFLLFPLSLIEEIPRGPSHSVQVGAACGPSLLSFVVHAAPTALASAEDKRWRMRFIRQFMRNAIEGLAQLHSCGILHTDVKPENLLMTLPAYEVLRKMKAEPLLRDSKGRLYRNSAGGGVGGGSHAANNNGAKATGVSDGGSGAKKGADGEGVTLSGLAEGEEQDRDLIFAKNRIELFNGVQTWITLRERHSHALMATEEQDVVEALGAIKVADLGNAVFVSNVRVAELQLKEHPSISERNELLMATSATATSVDPTALQQTAQYFQAAAAAHAFQTREYRAPEIIVGVQPLTRMLTPAMDVWSIGCLIFELITGSYLFNPHAAVQQEVTNGITPIDLEFRNNEVHLSMMQEICSTGPVGSGGVGGAASRTSSGLPSTTATPTTASTSSTSHIPDVIRRQGRMSEPLLRSMLPIAPDSLTGEPLLQLILEQRTFCDAHRRGEDASFRAELGKVAHMLGRIFRWEPLERPSMAELLAMPWLQDDGCG